MKKRGSRKLFGGIVFLAVMLTAGILVFLANYKLVCISGDSMAPTFKNGQWLIVEKNPKKIEKGDVLVFKKNNTVYMKRVVATSGDCVEYNSEYDFLSVNGIGLTDSFSAIPEKGESIIIPDDSYYVVGDNYHISKDSRSKDVGLVSRDELIGLIVGH